MEFRAASQAIVLENGIRAKISKGRYSRAAALVDSPSYAGSSVEVRHGEKRRLSVAVNL